MKSYAQINENALMQFYRLHQFKQIKQALAQVAPQDTSTPAYLFFKTLLIKDGLQAKRNYEQVYLHADNPLKKLAAQRLHDYYYALGLYVKAAQYEGTPSDSSNHAILPKNQSQGESANLFSRPSSLKIQFGAFSSKANAQDQAKLLRKQHLPVRIVERTINGRTLFCVWVDGLSNIEETRKFAEQIKKQVHLDYRIIKP